MEEQVVQAEEPVAVEETTEATTVEETVAEETQTEAEETVEETEEDTGETAEEEPQKKSGLQKRFSTLTAEKKAAQRYAERLEQHNLQLMEMMQKGQQPPQPETTQPPVASTPPPDKYDFDDEAQYQQAHNAWMDGEFNRRFEGLQTRAQEHRQKQQQETAQRETAEKLSSIKEQGSVKYEDFEDVAFIPHGLVDIVAVSENPEEIAYRWGKNPAEWQALMAEAQSNPYAVAAKIGRLDAEISARPVKQTAAPAPVKPIKGATEVSVNPDDLSIEEWNKLRDQGKIKY